MVKLAIISWPISQKLPLNGYINLGEIYDNNTHHMIDHIRKDLTYYYPFTCIINSQEHIICFNIEDFKYLQQKYNLTYNITYSQKIKTPTKIIFRTPVLYDLKTMKSYKLVIYDKIIPSITNNTTNIFFIVPAENNPIKRGQILDNCLKFSNINIKLNFILLSNLYKNNITNTNTLAKRYLLKKSISKPSITKLDYKLQDVLETYINFSNIDVQNIYLAINSNLMHQYMHKIKKLRKQGILHNKIKYVCD
jgi:hypothetical protein